MKLEEKNIIVKRPYKTVYKCGGFYSIPHGSGGRFDSVKDAGNCTLYRIKYRSDRRFNGVDRSRDCCFDCVPNGGRCALYRSEYRRYYRFDCIYYCGHHCLYRIPHSRKYRFDGVHHSADHRCHCMNDSCYLGFNCIPD